MADNPDGEYVRYEDLLPLANFLRGMSMDPELPIDTREALRDRATELDGLKI